MFGAASPSSVLAPPSQRSPNRQSLLSGVKSNEDMSSDHLYFSSWANNQINRRINGKGKYSVHTGNSHKHDTFKGSEATLDVLDKGEMGCGGVVDFRSEEECFTGS